MKTLIILCISFALNLYPADQAAMRLKCEKIDGDRTVTAWGSAVPVDLSEFGDGSRRYLITAAHCLDDGIVFVEARDGHYSQCVIVAQDKEADVALIRCDNDLPRNYKLAPAEEITLSGFPKGKPDKDRAGRVLMLTVDYPIVPGMSGGAALNAKGELIAIIVGYVEKSGEPAAGVLVSANTIRELIEKAVKQNVK